MLNQLKRFLKKGFFIYYQNIFTSFHGETSTSNYFPLRHPRPISTTQSQLILFLVACVVLSELAFVSFPNHTEPGVSPGLSRALRYSTSQSAPGEHDIFILRQIHLSKWAYWIFPWNSPDFFLGKYPVQPGKIPVAWAILHNLRQWQKPTWIMFLCSCVWVKRIFAVKLRAASSPWLRQMGKGWGLARSARQL